jgi:membrane protein implicated in regulation of membrane protease activity
MIGERGEAIEPFADGAGRVRVYGEIWAAHSLTGAQLEAGDPVRIAAVDGLTLEVEPEG